MDDSEIVPRSSLYRFLGRLWVREVDAAVLSLLRRGELADAYMAAGGAPPPEGADLEVLGSLGMEYGRLFLAPDDFPPPYQSVWESGASSAGAAASMEEYFKVFGYRPPWMDSTRRGATDRLLPVPSSEPSTGGQAARGTRRPPVDHLGIQLDCFGHLTAAFNRSFEAPELVRRELQRLASQFFQDHLTWPGPLLAFAAQEAQSDFYRGLITATGDLLARDTGIWTDSHGG